MLNVSILDPLKPIKDAVDNTVENAVRSVESVIPPLPGMKGGLPAIPMPPKPNLGSLNIGPSYKKGPDEYAPIDRDGVRTRESVIDTIRYEGKY